ncbi:unnamed protein product [Paramecium pentaurelia]|uniref:RING-type domain-containing protein n=1 Tax=Paramecium pentaurelia TaxID=43138 RepID=A0A8S1XPE3_9CILI|nr:unnamed protein product [Paramecium pentaurelia]
MLPNLRNLQKRRPTAITPDTSQKRMLLQKSEHHDIYSLKSQIESLQKQLEYVQTNKSFVMKITSPPSCTQCSKFKQQLDLQQLNEKITKRNYDQKIDELHKQSQKVILTKGKTIETDSRYDDLLFKLKQIYQYELLFAEDNTININNIQKIQFSYRNSKEQNQQSIQQLLLQLEEQDQIIKKQSISIKNYNSQIDQLNNVISNLQNQLDNLKKQLKDRQELNKKTLQTLPNEVSPKLNIDSQQDKSILQQLLFQNQSLKEKLIQQNHQIDKSAQENQIQKHLLRIEVLETELKLSLRCCRCQNLFEKPRTYIPCGHSCCEKCYKYKCDSCDTEAVYRNRQFDELIRVYYIIKDTKTFIQECLLRLQV